MTEAVRVVGGVIPQSDLYARGYSKHDIARGVADGPLIRIRRSWLAVPDADPYLVAAARAGVVITCVTQAQRLGLWVRRARTCLTSPPLLTRVACASSAPSRLRT